MASKRWSSVLTAVCVLACGGESQRDSDEGGPSGTAGRGGSSGTADCRVYASTYAQSGVVAPSTFDCSFARSSLTMSCENDADIMTTETWATLEDAVTENRPVGKYKAMRYTTGVSSETLRCTFAFDISFDSLGRSTSVVATPEILEGPCTSSSQFYDAWDAEGRPIHGTANGVVDACIGQDVSISYDDERRVVTFSQNGGTDCFDEVSATTYDANGITTRITSNDTVVYDNETLETREICLDE